MKNPWRSSKLSPNLLDMIFFEYYCILPYIRLKPCSAFIWQRISKLPSCLLVSICGIIVDVPLLLLLALWKSPFMLLKGWTRLFEDLVGREGPFLETVCVPFAALAMILWPIIVVAAVIGAFISSLFLAMYGGVIVYQVCILSC